jgi:holliday junction DNA helicase RuvA
VIGYLVGEVLFSDGKELIIKTKEGIGYQVYMTALLVESSVAEVFVSHVFRDSGQELFGFETLREKKLFELLCTVKGVGPKSAYSLISALGPETIIQSVQMENKKVLTKAPGVGAKAAAQICLDLGDKIQKVLMYSGQNHTMTIHAPAHMYHSEQTEMVNMSKGNSLFTASEPILEEAIMACKELGFKEDQIMPMAKKILSENEIKKAEQLVHLVLKEV